MQSICLLAVIFITGVSLGNRPDLLTNILSLGGSGMAFALSTLAGSVLAVFVLRQLLYRNCGDSK